MHPSIATIGRQFNATPAQVRAQFARNARQLEQMADKAKALGRKVNGYTEAQLREMAANAAKKAQ